MKTIVLVGCGGIGGWLAMSMHKLLTSDDVLVLVDKDKFETKNMDRQFCREADAGSMKAKVLARELARSGRGPKVVALTEWFGPGTMDVVASELSEMDATWKAEGLAIFCGADNHNARRAVLEEADRITVPAFIAANEYVDAEAYVYFPEWRGTELDPRIYYKELNTEDKHSDPTHVSCTGEAQVSTPQLALANYWAAGYATWLYYAWLVEAATRKLEDDAKDRLPMFARNTWGRFVIKNALKFKEEQEKSNG